MRSRNPAPQWSFSMHINGHHNRPYISLIPELKMVWIKIKNKVVSPSVLRPAQTSQIYKELVKTFPSITAE